MAAQLTVSQILTQAADILAAQGWKQEGDYDHVPYLPAEHCPVDLGVALALAAGVDMHSVEATSPAPGLHADAVLLLARHVFGDDAPVMAAPWALDKLTTWQDETGRTAEQVTAALRAAAAEPTAEVGYPAPGSEIPDMPGYVVGECGHRVAASEWRAKFRTCERCNFGGQTGGAR